MNVLTRSSTTLIPVSLKNSELLKYKHPRPIELWIRYADKSRELLESYELLEIQLFKNLHNVEHEFLIAKFRSPDEIIFVSVERSALVSHLDHAATDDDIIRSMIKARIDDRPNQESLAHTLSRASSGSLVDASMAYDMVMVIRGPTTFEDAADHFLRRQMRRFSRATYVHRGTMEFKPTSESNIASPSSTTDTSPAGPVPNLMHFSYVMIAAHRTRLYYTPTGHNCYWFANAILFILKEKFNPEPFIAHSTVGTWSFGPVKVSLGSLQKMDYEELINEYNKCQGQGGATRTKTQEEMKEEQRREAERREYEQQLLNAVAEAEAKTEAERAKKDEELAAERAKFEKKDEELAAERAKFEKKDEELAAERAKFEKKDEELAAERAKFEKKEAEYRARINALEMASAKAT